MEAAATFVGLCLPSENASAHVAQSPASLHEELHSGTRSYGEYRSSAMFPFLPYSTNPLDYIIVPTLT